MSLHIFGIRHHGPGSARSLREALEKLRPDCVLVEGPPDAAEAMPLLAHPQMKPPVALLIYPPDQPQRAVFYPFAVFSPEWQALDYGLARKIAVRFMDLPQAHRLAMESDPDPQISDPESKIHDDPIGRLAAAAGYSDGERWWEHMVEHRRDGADLFAAILEAMTALRESSVPIDQPAADQPIDQSGALPEVQREAQREAWMRQTIRAAAREGFERIAVVCGAWHAPALTIGDENAPAPSEKDDAELLKGLPKVKTQATWTPWTYGRLSYRSGYGAGVESPGWYHHLWTSRDSVPIRWMTRVARLMREEDLDVSSAHVIEAVRLAETLAALRDRPLPGLSELNEATQSVFCFGNDLPMRLVHEKLIVGETLGCVPAETPLAPLQQDLAREQKRLRLPAEALESALDLDLRKPNDLDRSRLLHRLLLLGVRWGETQGAGGKGTFHEIWRLRWQPEFVVALIEAGVWGNTIFEAATAYARDAADRAKELPTLTDLLDRSLLADLPGAVSHAMSRLQAEAAVASDIAHLMDALPPLANVQRYGNVRGTDAGMVGGIVAGLIARVCIGLPGACASLNDEAAAAMFERIVSVNAAIGLLQDEERLAAWRGVMTLLADQRGLHGLVAGRCCRLLVDAGVFAADEAARRLSLALSTANEPAQAAAWIEGFLKESGLLLLHDETLWATLDEWVTGLPGDSFTALAPLLRRTFSTFTSPERRQIGERARRGMTSLNRASIGDQARAEDFDKTRAEAVLPLVAQLLGLAMIDD
ncbi:MAG TPA: DUF5682 family protein [Blastocatellia bacterium]|nr:DUF5682 family protein [Blastocatellia bacterium]